MQTAPECCRLVQNNFPVGVFDNPIFQLNEYFHWMNNFRFFWMNKFVEWIIRKFFWMNKFFEWIFSSRYWMNYWMNKKVRYSQEKWIKCEKMCKILRMWTKMRWMWKNVRNINWKSFMYNIFTLERLSHN